MSQIVKIVLTGGPCAGKTTALQRIENEFTEKGYKVFIVGESATEIIQAGARPFGILSIPTYTFQKEIVGYQLYKEAMYERYALSLPEETKCLIVCDRGALDNKAYIDSEEFARILEELSLSEIDLLSRYQAVLHLVTAANGAEEFYTLANNDARSESTEEARILDQKTMNCWIGHSNLEVIGNDQNFERKMNQVIQAIHRVLGIPVPIQKQQKFLIDEKNMAKILSSISITKKIRIEQTYLSLEEECCVRKMSDQEASIYYEISKKDTKDLETRIKTMRKLSEKEYLKAISQTVFQPIIKDRYSFVYHNQYFKMDVFHNLDLCLLEIEQTGEQKIAQLPEGIQVLDEVTKDPRYRNFALFQQINEKAKQKMLV